MRLVIITYSGPTFSLRHKHQVDADYSRYLPTSSLYIPSALLKHTVLSTAMKQFHGKLLCVETRMDSAAKRTHKGSAAYPTTRSPDLGVARYGARQRHRDRTQGRANPTSTFYDGMSFLFCLDIQT